MIELKDLTVAYGDKPVLRGLDATLPDDGCVAVRGASGAGKTTLLRVLAGLVAPAAGSISGLSQRCVSMVFQEDRLLPWRSALENVALVSNGDTAREWLALVGLSKEGDSLPGALSGGMRRRVAIARALAYSDDVLLLDEPFTGLDAALRARVAAEIRSRARLIVLVTHDAEEEALLGAGCGIALGG